MTFNSKTVEKLPVKRSSVQTDYEDLEYLKD